MDYGTALLRRLREEQDKGIYADPRQKLYYVSHQEGEFQFQVRFQEVEKVGIVLDYISIAKEPPIQDVEEINRRLDEQADAVQKRITFLLEDFKLIEMDSQNKRAQLRSYPPYKEEDSRYYYEIVLDEGTRVHFQRYQYSSKQRRYEKVTSQMTVESFTRLINELTDILK